MFKKFFLVMAILLLITLSLWNHVKTSNLHLPIKAEDISRVTLWGVDGHKEATQEDVYNIINWFNSASDIRENIDFAGETPDSGIIIYEKNGKELSIIRSGKDFEVQRNDESGKRYSYWAIQNDIKILLGELAHHNRIGVR